MTSSFPKWFGACALALAALAPGCLGSHVTAVRASATTGGGQSLQQAWTIGGSTAWVWTQGPGTGSPQRIDLTVNGGRSWADVTPPGLGIANGVKFITGFCSLDAAHAWVTFGGLQNGAAQTIDATSDAGRRWTAVGHEPLTSVEGSEYDCSLDFVTPSDGWCETMPPFVGHEAVYLYHTTDGGRQWKLIYVTEPGTSPRGGLPWACDKEIQFVSPARGWAIFSCSGSVTAPLYETTDAGKTWTEQNVAKAPGAFDGGSGFTGMPLVTGARGAVGYTIGGRPLESVVYVSTNGGAAWHPVTPPGPDRGWVMDTITPTTWRLVQGDLILATGNAGRTWRTIISNVTFDIYYTYLCPTPPVVNFATTKIGWIVSTSLWRTTNGGSTWRRVAVPGVRLLHGKAAGQR
jgi:hypothetical protein